jgi:hypothetical protein
MGYVTVITVLEILQYEGGFPHQWPVMFFFEEYILTSGFGGLVVSMLASGFKPGRSRRIFSGEKILSMPSFGREVKPFAPCRKFAACKRTL